jgi:hypothetical protein
MSGKFAAVLLLVSLAVARTSGHSANPQEPVAFDSLRWIADFQQLISEMSGHYAGLEFAVEERKIDLPKLKAETEAGLRSAKSDTDAYRVLQRFLGAFGDGHLEIEWPDRSATPSGKSERSVCSALGYDARLKAGLDFSSVPTFSELDTADGEFYPGGLLRLPSGKVVGVLRIGLFTEHAFPELCERAVKGDHLLDGACNEICANHVELQVANFLTAGLSSRAKALRAAGATVLLVDITHNGGGSDWVEAAARELSSVPLYDSRMAFLRHPHWTENLSQELADVQTDLDNKREPEPLLNQAATSLKAAIDETRKTCSLEDVWETGKVDCSMLVKGELFVSGVLSYAKPGSFASLASKATLFAPLRYEYQEDSNRMPLFVLVDRDTWSSAEYFAGILQDNHAAIILGESTGGAGCGYTNGGIPIKLRNSGALVKMPDCVRFRADGSNEVNGIQPDLPIAWPRQASDYQRIEALIPILDKALASVR